MNWTTITKTAAMPTTRSSGWRSAQRMPRTHSGTSTIDVKSTCSGQYCTRFCQASPWSVRNTARFGQPCAACQTRSGAASTTNAATPQARYLPRSSGRAAAVHANPSSSPARRNPMFHFALIPMPAAAPMAGHQRGSRLVSSLVIR